MEPNGLVMLPGAGPVRHMLAPGRFATLKLQNDDTASSVMMFEETAPVGTVTDFHLHHDSDEIAYVLAGEVTFKIGDEVTVGGPGSCAFMPRDVAHAWKSTGGETARLLFLYTPGRAGRVFEELQRRPAAALDERERAHIIEQHGWEIVGPPPF